MPEISEAVANQAAAVQKELNTAIQTIRENGDLTPEGKTKQLASAYLRAEQKMNGVRDSWDESTTRTVATGTKDVFGAVNTEGADAISVRDAADRARQIQDADEASQLLSWAERNGDQVLARAIAQRAYDETKSPFGAGWGEVLGTYTEPRPDVAHAIQEIDAARRDDVETGFRSAITFSLHKPSELERVPPAVLAELAT
jgi:hypothetical protein